MNKYQEALKKLCDGCEYNPIIGECSFRCPAKEELKELVEKATPKKIEKKYMELKGFIYYNCVCPNCGKTVCFETQRDTVKHEVNYCWKCGQALDWSEEDE